LNNAGETCYNCPNLRSKIDGAGGGTYHCAEAPGLVLAEWGHWVKDAEDPTPLENCSRGKLIKG